MSISKNEIHNKVYNALAEIFNPDSENYIELEDLEDSETNELILAMAVKCPCLIYSKLSGDKDINFLTFNHLSNHLLFQELTIDKL